MLQDAQQLMHLYSTNMNLVVISAIAFAIGYIEYIYSFRLVLREKKAPFPLWMHAFYFAHDLTASIVFFNLARQFDFFWFFTAASIALLIWNVFEIFNLYMAVKYEKEEILGDYYPGEVSSKGAVIKIIGMIIIMFGVVNYFRITMEDYFMFKWFAMTNIIMAVGPGYLWAKRRSREGASVGLAIVILVGTFNTFLPPGYGMWTTALPQYFDHAWYYIIGTVFTGVALWNLIMLLRFSPKEKINGEKIPIW